MIRRFATGLACAATAFCWAGVAAAQDPAREIRDSQLRLEQIRGERVRIQREMDALQARVQDVTTELTSIMRMRATSADALRELEYQAAMVTGEVDATTGELLRTRDRLTERNVVLQQRLRWIYKQGPLHTVRVLLGARSFSDLLNRYKYLQLIAMYDRALVDEVSRLEQELVHQDRILTEHLALLQRLRAEKLDEDAQLRQLEARQERVLRTARQEERALADRLEQLARDETRITNLIAQLEARRQDEERRAAVAGAPPRAPGTITTADLGSLPWPVDGNIIYRFGPEVRPNGVTLRWNGIGIGAPAGSPVAAVESGTVVMAAPLEGYGPSVVVSHGAGYYTLYLHLATVSVRDGDSIQAGQTIGTVGGERSADGPHIEFRVHAPGPAGAPVPVDPLGWLRSRSDR